MIIVEQHRFGVEQREKLTEYVSQKKADIPVKETQKQAAEEHIDLRLSNRAEVY